MSELVLSLSGRKRARRPTSHTNGADASQADGANACALAATSTQAATTTAKEEEDDDDDSDDERAQREAEEAECAERWATYQAAVRLS